MVSRASLQNVAFPPVSKPQTPTTTAFRISCSSAFSSLPELFSNGLSDMDGPALTYIDKTEPSVEEGSIRLGVLRSQKKWWRRPAEGCNCEKTARSGSSEICPVKQHILHNMQRGLIHLISRYHLPGGSSRTTLRNGSVAPS